QLLARVLPNGFEQAKPCLVRVHWLTDFDEGFIRQARQRLQHVFPQTLATHRLRGLEREAARKHSEAAQQRALTGGQQMMAAFDERQERLVARQGGATAPRKQAEAIIEPRRDLLWWKDLHARRRQLNRQRNAIQAPADLRDGRGVLFSQAKGGIRCRRALDK